MSYSLKLKLFDYEYDLTAQSLDSEAIIELIQDYVEEVTSDLLSEYEPEACGYFPQPWETGEKAYLATKHYIENNCDELTIHAFLDGEEKQTIPIDIPKIMFNILDERSTCEQENIDTGSVMLNSLGKFIEQGAWQYGLKRVDGKTICDINLWPEPVYEENRVIWKDTTGEYLPIVWFGLLGEEPIDCWSICEDVLDDEDAWQSFWYYDYGEYDWEALLDGQTDSYVHWMFFECGMDEPSIEPVRQTCPIDLSKEDSNEEILRKVEQFVLKTRSAI